MDPDNHLTFRNLCNRAQKPLSKAVQLAGIHSDPVFIFRSLLQHLATHRTILPTYSSMQRHIISKAILEEQARLEGLLTKLLDESNKEQLDQLLEIH